MYAIAAGRSTTNPILGGPYEEATLRANGATKESTGGARVPVSQAKT
jgi:hypothetical protein